ncbi:transcription factor Tfb4-domain-containing protein [Lentinula aff. lateritia]|uniref:Transcription factor Tfb4-domain-containing protein n=1 Tax=Lentinula aff. lateritia TaxID=2804960 RepID=A0ACC1UCW8_9AGAR|nr:transcription factor Tfb4-domain-containing protein [Lentinula aff. lateritia]
MDGSHLSVVVDLCPSQWHLSSLHQPYPLDLGSFVSQLLAFLNSHIASRHGNSLAVFGAFPGKSVLLYSSANPPSETPSNDANSFPPFKMVDSTIMHNIVQQLDALDQGLDEEAPSALVGALTKALCFINRLTLEFNTSTANATEGLEPLTLSDPRILVLSVSPDQTASYIPVMNSIFSAQKLKVTIDACQIYGPETVFLQQAAHLTGGSYIYLERRDALLQYLTMAFLPPPSIRQTISVPTQDKIDFRAACFCHKNIVDVGFVCSVCLSTRPRLFDMPVCASFSRSLHLTSFYRTKFPIKTLQRLNAARPSLPLTSTSQSRNSSTPPTPQKINGHASVTPSQPLGPGGLPPSGSINDNSTFHTNGTKNGLGLSG